MSVQVYAFGLFAVELLAQFGWSRAQVYFAHTITTLITGICSPFIGKWVDKHGIQPTITIGAFAGGALFALLGLTQSIWYLYGIYAIMAIAQALAGQVPVNTMITNWFERRRGSVLGILATGVGWGGMIMPPLIALIITNLGWRGAYAVLGVSRILLLTPLIALVFRFRPEEKGLLPDGRSLEEEEALQAHQQETADKAAPGWSVKGLLRQPAFWFLFSTFFFLFFALNAVLYHAIPFFTDKGFSATVAAAFVSGIAFCGIVGKLSGGFIADRIGPKPVSMFAYVLQALAVFVALTANSTPFYWLFAALFGLSFGGVIPMMPMLVVRSFGRASFGTIYGMLLMAMSAGVGIGPLVSGYLFDITGNYNIPFSLAIGSLLTACVTVFFARTPKQNTDTAS
jgi:sugar phosphate permease